MYAVIETGGKQHRVTPGESLLVERIAGEPGTQIELRPVLAVSTDANQLLTGADAAGARVKATIAGQERGDKLIVFKFKRKKQYKRTIGHRQNLTRLTVDSIEV